MSACYRVHTVKNYNFVKHPSMPVAHSSNGKFLLMHIYLHIQTISFTLDNIKTLTLKSKRNVDVVL